MTRKARKTINLESAGARESNAGDDFHILWAARRAVALLDPSRGLRRVFVEKVSPADGEPLREDDYFLGVDLSEYYGGDDFQTATKVVVSQFKYSTRHPSRHWTVSRLCASPKNKTSSVIRRLADVYKGFADQAPREEVIAKLSIRLVSNQPGDLKLRSALQAAQKVLNANATPPAPVTRAHLLKNLTAEQKKVIGSLSQKAGLRSSHFTDFLRVLDLSETGMEARVFQRLRLIQELAPFVSVSPVAALRNLRELVAREANPEGRLSRGLTDADVIAALEVSHKDDLFPAPSYLTLPAQFVETRDARELAATVLGAESGRVLAHGDAGVGKTTIVQSLAQHLPTGSIVIIYDCYGGGSYLDAGEQRHTNSRALLQLTNELAVRCGTPFLIRPSREKYDLQREFRRALDAAVKIIAVQGGLLVIAIDAADNAVVAAATAGDEECFVPALWKLSLPAGSRLLMTSRSHRRLTLQPTTDVVEYELAGFDRKASTEHLRMLFPAADGASGTMFHERTNGNPRVQYYLLDRAKHGEKAVASLENLLDASERTPDSIFADLLDAAVKYVPAPGDSRRLLAALVCLSRPVPLRVFADACSIKLDDARNFCRSLVPGLILKEDATSFRDEDFETYLRGHVSETEIVAAHERLASHFLALSETDPYAARVVAEHLFQGGRHAEVIRLAVNGPEPIAIQDQMQRLEVISRRVTLAMQSARFLGSELEGARLTLLAAELARSDSAVTALVRENPELAAHYGDSASVTRLYMREENSNWLGAAHLRTAAIYARDRAQHDRAREQLNLAEAWIRRWSTLPRNERYGWDLSARDLAAGAEAIFWLVGAERTRDWLSRWRPVSFVLKAIEKLGTSLATTFLPEEQERLLAPLHLRPRFAAALLASLWQAGGTPSRNLVENEAKNLDRFLKREANFLGRQEKQVLADEDRSSWVVPFCELAASLGVDTGLTLRLIRALCPPMPDTTPPRYYLSPYDAPLRAVCLDAAISGLDLSIDDLIPERFRLKEGENEHKHASERREFGELIGKVLSIHKLRARVLIQPTAITQVSSDILSDMKFYREASEHRWFKGDSQYLTWAKRACDVVLACSGDAESLLDEIASLAERTAPGGAAWLWKDIAEKLAPHDAYRPLAYRLLERSSLRIVEEPVPAQERWELLLSCSEIAGRYDEGLGRDYYARALSAAEGIDDDSIHLLSLQVRLARQVALGVETGNRREYAERLSRNLEAHEDFVSERSRLPWEQTLGVVTQLDPTVGAALCSRWDDENRLGVDYGIVPFIEEAVGAGFLLPFEGLSLLRLTRERFDVSKPFILLLDRLIVGGGFERQQVVQALRTMSEWIRRDVPVRTKRSAAEQIVAWSEAHGVDKFGGISELRNLISFASGFAPEKEDDGGYSYHREDKEGPTLDDLFAFARDGSLEDLDNRVGAVSQRSSREKGVREFLMLLGRSIAPGERLAYLEAVVAIKPDRLFVQSIAEALAEILTEWRSHASIREWAAAGIVRFFENHLPAILAYDYHAASSLSAVLSVPQLRTHSRASILLPAVSKHLEMLGPRSLYLMADMLTSPLERDDLKEVFEWSLARTERRLEENGARLANLPSVSYPDSAPETLARFFWALFGHPDKHVRWRAIHAARGILSAPQDVVNPVRNRQLLSELLKHTHYSGAGRFRSEHLEFYPMSAFVWLLLLLERLADEIPRDLADYAPTIAEYAVDRQFPHAQAREIARRAAVRIGEHITSALEPGVRDDLIWANRPPWCFFPRGNAYGSRYDGQESDQEDGWRADRRFSFDWLDTLRYWYPPVSRIFGDPPPDLNITARAESWICDRWGRTDNDWWKDPRELGDRYQREQMENGQGQIPHVENLRTYLEYHALFCAAGEMANDLPENVPDWGPDGNEEVESKWTNWINEHVGTSREGWLSDRRTPTPYRADCWSQFSPIEEWLRRDDPKEYDAELGLSENGHDGEIVISGNLKVGDSDRRGTVHVASAIVCPEMATSLLRALQTASNSNDWILPTHDRGFGEKEIDSGGFELKAWLEDRRFDEGLDEFDPLARGVRGSFTTFAKDFLDKMGVTRTLDGRQFTSSNGNVVAYLEIWNDDFKESRNSESFSEGERLWIRLDTLLEYLRLGGHELILEVKIARNREHSQRNEEEKYDLGKSRLYLVRRDGTIETLDGCRQIG